MSMTLLNKLKKEFEEKQAKIDTLTTVVKKLSWNRTDRYKGILGTNIVIGPDPKAKKQIEFKVHTPKSNKRNLDTEKEISEDLNQVINVFRFPKRHANHELETIESELESFILAKLKLESIGGDLDLSYAGSSEDVIHFDITEHVFDQDLFDSNEFNNSFMQDSMSEDFDSSDKIENFQSAKSSTLQQEYDSLFALDIENYKSFIDTKSNKMAQNLYIHKRMDLMIVFKKFLISADRVERIRKQFFKSEFYKNKVRHKESFKYHIYDKGDHIDKNNNIEFGLKRIPTFKDSFGLAPIIFPETIKDTHGKIIEEKFDEVFQHLLCEIFKFFYTHELEVAKEHKEVNDCAKSFIQHIKWRDKNNMSAINHPSQLEAKNIETQTEFIFSNAWDLADIRVADFYLDYSKPNLTKVTLVKNQNETIVRHFEYTKYISNEEYGLDKDKEEFMHKRSELELKLRKMENEINQRNKILKELNQ